MHKSSDETPQWDVALAALAREECAKCDRPLRIEDFRRLATQHAIRFDDIMETMFKLVIHGAWQYRDVQGVSRVITQQTLDGLYVNRRLRAQDMQGYDGAWAPL